MLFCKVKINFKSCFYFHLKATNLFMKILDAEVHEGTLVVALENLALWASKFGREAPEKFIVGIAKGVGQASSSVLVQTSYLCCLQAAVNSFSTVDQVRIYET